MRCLGLLIAGCSSTTPIEILPDGPPQSLGLDVVVGHQGVAVFADGTSRPFPQVGQQVEWDDVITMPCFTASLEVAGTEVSMKKDVIGIDDAWVLIHGCGGSARIRVGDHIPPIPTVTAVSDLAANTVSIQWTASSDPSTSVVGVGNGAYGQLVHVVGEQYAFTASRPYVDGIEVWTFGPLEIVETDYGVVRVWTGDHAWTWPCLRSFQGEITCEGPFGPGRYSR